MNSQETATKKKLKKANFFLEKLISFKNQPDRFRYYVSAFLSSSRSISWIIRSEYGNNPLWKKWWENKQLPASEDKIFRLITEARNKSQKSDSYGIGPEVSLLKPKEPIDKERLKRPFNKGKKILVALEYNDKNTKTNANNDSDVFQKKNKFIITNARYIGFEPIFTSKIFKHSHSERVIESCENTIKYFKNLLKSVFSGK